MRPWSGATTRRRRPICRARWRSVHRTIAAQRQIWISSTVSSHWPTRRPSDQARTGPVSVLLVIYCALLVACAVTDFLWLRIPNSLVASLVALFFIGAAFTHAPVSLVRHVVPALGMFAFTVILFWL